MGEVEKKVCVGRGGEEKEKKRNKGLAKKKRINY